MNLGVVDITYSQSDKLVCYGCEDLGNRRVHDSKMIQVSPEFSRNVFYNFHFMFILKD